MTVKTCLLVSDDPDDQLHFTEALTEISPETVLLTVLNSKKALEIIRQHKFVPDYIFLDLTMLESRHDEFTAELENFRHDGQARPRLVLYGEEEPLIKDKTKQVTPLEKDFTYTELKDFLKRSLQR